jgi:signal peptidase II
LTTVPVQPDDARADSRWRWLGVFVPLAVMVDQVAKWLADKHLPRARIVPVVEGFFDLRYTTNTGAFFSLGADLPEGIRRPLFAILTLVAIALVSRLYHKSASSHRLLRASLLLLLSGAVGNLIDRVVTGYVIDFLHIHWQDAWHWATFNVADIYICIGVFLLAADVLRPPGPYAERHGSEPFASEPPSSEPPSSG